MPVPHHHGGTHPSVRPYLQPVTSPFPRPEPPGAPEGLPYPILRWLSSPGQSSAGPCHHGREQRYDPANKCAAMTLPCYTYCISRRYFFGGKQLRVF